MAKQPTPVVLDEEENQDTQQTVGERIAAGELELDDSPATITEEGIPRVDIRPVNVELKPDPKASVPSQVQVTKTKPKLPDVKTPTSVGEAITAGKQVAEAVVEASPIKFKRLAAQEDIARREEEATKVTTYADVLAKLDAGETVVIETYEGTKRYSGPNAAKLARTPEFTKQIKLNLALQESLKRQRREETAPTDPTIAFVSETGEIDTSYLDPDVRPLADEYAKGRKKLDDVLRPIVNTGRPDVDVAVRQFFIDEMATGDFLSNLTTRLNETGRAAVVLPNYAADYAGSAMEAMRRAFDLQTSFKEEWNALSDDRQQRTDNILRDIDRFIPAPTLAMGMNDLIRDRAKKDLAEGKLTQEQFDNFVYETTLDGQKTERQFIDDATAYAVVEESFSQMNAVEQWGVILAENFFGGTILGKTKNARSVEEANRAIKIRDTLNMGKNVSLVDVQRLALYYDKKVKLDKDLIELGTYNKEIARQTSEAKTRADDLMKQSRQVGISNQEKIRLQAEADNLYRLNTRNFLRNKVSPYVLEVAGADIRLATAAVASRQFLDGVYGMDAETAELFGLGVGLFGEITGGSKFVTRLGVGVTQKAIGLGAAGITAWDTQGKLSPFGYMFRKLTQQDLTIDDYEKLYLDRKLTVLERKQISAAFKQIEKMDENTRDSFLNIVQEQRNLEDELLKMFPEGAERAKAAEILNQSLAEISGLPMAIAAYQMAAQTASVKKAKKGGLGSMLEAALEVDRVASRGQLLIQGFQKHAAEFANPQQVGAVRELLKQTESSLTNVQKFMDLEFNKLNTHVDAMISDTVSDISEPLPETFLEDYVEIKNIISKRLSLNTSKTLAGDVASVEESRELILQTQQDLLSRFKTIRSIRNKKDLHRNNLSTAVEALIFQRQGVLALEMDEAYEGFREFVKTTDRPNIDISPVVTEMLRLAGDEISDIEKFFSPTSTFFGGYLGRKSRKMFEAMVERTMNTFSEEEVQEMITSIVEASGGRITAEEITSIAKQSPTQFGLLLHKTGSANVFANANIEEIEEFRRAFRDYGYKTTNPAVSREYSQFTELVDDIMKENDPVGHEFLLKVRKIYQQKNDPNRPGSVLNRILSSKTGDKVTEDSTGLSGLYKGATPIDVMGDMGKSVAKIMGGGRGKTEAIGNLRNQIAGLEQLFGVPDKNTGQMRINLNTEEGRVALELMEEVIEAIVYDAWAADFLSKAPTIGQRVDPRNLGFKQSIIDELDEINEIFNINVTDLDGNPDQVLVFNITDMVSREKDIAKLIAKGNTNYNTGKRAVEKLKRTLSEAKGEAKIEADYSKKSMKVLEDIINIKDSGSFYERYISGMGDLDSVRSKFKEVISEDPELKGADLDTIFDNAVYNMTYQGLIQKGGYGPKGRLAATDLREIDVDLKQEQIKRGLLQEPIVTHGFENVIGALAELENPEVVKNLEKVMPREQIENLHGIFFYLARQQAANLAVQLGSKGMSTNEAISRAYNIARGMVSPSYVVTEVTLRLMQKHNSDVMLLALQSKDAARIMEKMLRYPKLVTKKELNAFDTLLTEFFATEVARYGLEETLTNYVDQYLEEEETNEEQK